MEITTLIELSKHPLPWTAVTLGGIWFLNQSIKKIHGRIDEHEDADDAEFKKIADHHTAVREDIGKIKGKLGLNGN